MLSIAPGKPTDGTDVVRQHSRFYRPELDALRFVAFSLVFVAHIMPSSIAVIHRLGEAFAAGVCLFFTLSAYLITELLRRELQETGSINLQAFYIRRVLRIWPLYFAVMLSVALIGLFVSSMHIEIARLLAYLLLCGNVYIMLYGWGTRAINPLWSISLEEQFYLLWPSIFKYGGKRTLVVIALLLPFLSVLAIALTIKHSTNTVAAVWVNSFVQFQFFGFGALLALMLDGRVPRLKGWLRGAILCLSFLLLLSGEMIFHIRDHVEPHVVAISLGYLMVGVGCIGLIVGVLGIQCRVPGAMVKLGKISYGLYAFHSFAIMVFSEKMGKVHGWLSLLKLLLIGGTTLLLASISYKYLETPFLRLKDKFTVVRSRAL